MPLDTTQPINNKKYKFTLITLILLIVLFILFGTAALLVVRNKDKTINTLTYEKSLLLTKNGEKKLCNVTIEKLQKSILHLQPKLDPIIATEISEVVIRECTNRNLDPALLIGLMYVESNFNPFAESGKGAIGLTQVRYHTWKEEPELIDSGVSSKGALFWIDRNVTAGIQILQKYYTEADCDIAKALYRYNTGRTTLAKEYWEIEYINKVIYNSYLVKAYLLEDNKCSSEIITEEEPLIIKGES